VVCSVCGGVGVGGCGDGEACADGILFDVGFVGLKFFWRVNLRLFEALRPDVEFAFEAEREASLDILHGFFEGDFGRGRDNGVQVIGHDDEGVELIATFGPVSGKDVEEEISVLLDLESATAVRGDSGDEVECGALEAQGAAFGKDKGRPGAEAPFLFSPYSGA
jgi:hypothetical protein